MDAGIGGVMLQSTDWQGGLRDRELPVTSQQRDMVMPALESSIETIKAKVNGRIHALVNNAATTKFNAHGNLDGLSGEDFLRIYGINVVGPYQMIRAVAPHMKKAGRGVVVNIASLAGVNAIGSSVAYCASKAALINMTVALARVLGPEIRVNAICPGFI